MRIIFFLFISVIFLFSNDSVDFLLKKANNFIKNDEILKAVSVYEDLDENNVTEASFNLGMIYAFGINDIDINEKLAIKYLNKASIKYHKKAPYYLALVLINNKSVEDTNETKIHMLIMESAISGFDKAQFQFGKLLLEHNNTTDAKKWIGKARKQGNIDAEALWHELYDKIAK